MSVTSQDAAERALHLHEQHVVLDSLTPDMARFSRSMYEAMRKMMDDGAGTLSVWPAMKALADDLLLADDYPEYWQWWADSGVDVASITMGGFGPNPFGFYNAVNDIARWTRRFDRFPDRLRKVTSSHDLDVLKADHARGVILGFQNSDHIEGDLNNLRLFHGLGVRIIQLTYNLRNIVGDGFAEREPAGLSKFGVDVVHRMNDLGLMVDVSHCSEPTTLDAIEFSRAPVAITHAFASDLNGHPRGKSDVVLRAIGNSSGYFGVVLVPFFLKSGGKVGLGDFLEHFDRAVALAGPEHVGVGSDWGLALPTEMVQPLNEAFARLGFDESHGVDWGARIDGYESWAQMPNVTAALLEHGYSESDVAGFIGGNFRRLFAETCG